MAIAQYRVGSKAWELSRPGALRRESQVLLRRAGWVDHASNLSQSLANTVGSSHLRLVQDRSSWAGICRSFAAQSCHESDRHAGREKLPPIAARPGRQSGHRARLSSSSARSRSAVCCRRVRRATCSASCRTSSRARAGVLDRPASAPSLSRAAGGPKAAAATSCGSRSVGHHRPRLV